MKEHDIKFAAIPSTEEVKAERERLAYRSRYTRVLRSTIYALVVVAAVAVLLATLFLPVLQVSGDSMNPTLQDKDVIVLVKSGSLKTGDLCGFYWQNKLLLKRVIGLPGDIISLDENGVVTVNGTVLDEPMWTNWPWANATSSSPIRCRRTGTSFWATTAQRPSTAAAASLAA